jgi:hypothetical protein
VRVPFVAVVAATLLSLMLPSADAETWAAGDRRADVKASPYRPSADPCDQPPDRRQRNDKRHDIRELAVDHGTEALVLSLSMRDVARRDASTSYELHLRTPDRNFYVDVTRYEPDGDLELFLAKEPDYPSPAELGEDCTFAFASEVLPCDDLAGDAEVTSDLVIVTIPRACLGDPRWVRVAAEVYGFTKTDAQGRFTVFRDVWASHREHKSGFLPPFGPRVHSG